MLSTAEQTISKGQTSTAFDYLEMITLLALNKHLSGQAPFKWGIDNKRGIFRISAEYSRIFFALDKNEIR